MDAAELETATEDCGPCPGQVVDVPLIPEPASSTEHDYANGDKSSEATNGHAVVAQDSHSHGGTGATTGARELEVGSVPPPAMYILLLLRGRLPETVPLMFQCMPTQAGQQHGA